MSSLHLYIDTYINLLIIDILDWGKKQTVLSVAGVPQEWDAVI